MRLQQGNNKAQLSLEYLVLLASFFSIMLLMLPLAQQTYSAAIFAFDVRQAQAFSHNFAETAKQLSVLSDGSFFLLQITPLNEWKIAVKGNRLFVFVQSKGLEKEKTIETILASEVSYFEKNFSESAEINFYKKNALLAVNSDP